MLLFISILFMLGTLFGSFSTVLIERWNSGKRGIMWGRSECPHCNHQLTARELIPIWSYILQWAKCRNCHTPISSFYPAAEILMWLVFASMGMVFFMGSGELFSGEMILLLCMGFITGVYILYDARYMEVPDQIMVPAIYGYLFLLLGSIVFPTWETLFFDRVSFIMMSDLIRDHMIAAICLYTFFYVQILIPGAIFLVRQKKWKQTFELILSYFIFPVELFFSMFRRVRTTESNSESEIPTWVGWGDLRIALFIGLTLGIVHGVFAFFCAYLFGSIVGIVLLIKNGRKNARIAFWPFLGIGWIIALLLYTDVLEYINLFAI